MAKNHFGRFLVAIITAVALAGCTTMQPLETVNRESIAERVQVGDEVELHHVNGTTYQFVVTRLTSDSISGDGNTILMENIDTISVREVSSQKTAGAVVGGIGVVLLATVAIVYVLLRAFDKKHNNG